MPSPRPAESLSHVVRLDRGLREAQTFDLTPDADARAALSDRLGILGVRKLRLAGRLAPEGKRDWRLEAELGATVVQACVVALRPVTTRIDESVERLYLAEMPELPDGEEIEMPDETIEPLPPALDLGAVMEEALALALPLWPRSDGAKPGERTFAGPGVQPMTNEDTRPFAGLKSLLRDSDGEA
jgi:uncharacterized metal-binding protein YceD (DUF177 family)